MSGQDPLGQPAGPNPNQPPGQYPAPGNPIQNPYTQPHPNQSGPPQRSNTVWIVLAVCLAGMIPVMGVCAGLLLPAVQQARKLRGG